MVGKFQSRFGVDSNSDALDGFDAELTIAQRLQTSGYVTAHFGKWHLGATNDIPVNGFKHAFAQNSGAPFHANLTLHGDDREMSVLKPEMYHIDACSQAAASVIQRYKDSPFFLYIAYRAPHVPLDAPQKYLDRFPGEMPQRRRQALAMLSASPEQVHDRCKRVQQMIGNRAGVQIVACQSQTGGGSVPGTDLPSYGLQIEHEHLNLLAERLRSGRPAIQPRIHDDSLLLDLRTVTDEQCVALSERLRGLLDASAV